MKLNCRQAKDAAMEIRKARLERYPLSYDDKLILERISDQITAAIEKGEDFIRIEIGSQLHPTMTRQTIELIKDHCKANEFIVEVVPYLLHDGRYLQISGW